MSEKRFVLIEDDLEPLILDNKETMSVNEVVDKLNEQQATIEEQKRIIKSQDAEISRQYSLCLAMSGILREEFGVYDVFDRTKDKNIKEEDDYVKKNKLNKGL